MALVKYNNNSISAVTSTALAEGSLVPIKTLTASGSASLSFVNGSNDVVLDSTYPIYKFEFININGSVNASHFNFNFSTDGGSNYNVPKTSTYFNSSHNESDTSAVIGYNTGGDLANGTGDQNIYRGLGNASDEHLCGHSFLFNPSSSVFVKHFLNQVQNTGSSFSAHGFTAGYGNTTSPINAVIFKVNSGTFDGTIKLYGIKDS